MYKRQDEHGIDLPLVFNTIRQAVMGKKRWNIEEYAFIGLFSFSQFVMWNDLRNRSEEISQNKVVSSLMAGSLTYAPEDISITPENIDSDLDLENMAVPMSADSSQLAAIAAAGSGQSFVLHGPPGTGKTLLAKAVAGEAGVPFFSISGSNFVEMFVGVGASRVRDLFEQAKRNAPCIIFIDEIDAVARRRGTGLGGGHDEREQTLNQMLVEMDGFGVNEGIIVMAATNRVDILDPAILRPGRFDRKVAVGRPDVKGREEILKVHTKNKPLGSDVNLRRVAQTTAGFTGADLENLMNEAAINAAKSKQGYISQRDIEQSFVKVGIGAEKHSKVISDKEKRITAYHESGHAILFHVLPHESQVHTISIIPTGMGAAGYTMPLPEADEMFMTKKRMEEDIIVAFGGRVAEELIFGDVTTGASQDIKQATATARAMVVKYGMSERLGTINYEDSGEEEVFLGRDLGHARSYSEDVAREIDIEVKRIIDEAYAQAKTIITEHMDVLHRCAQVLIEREKIGNAEFEAIFDGRELPEPGAEQTSLMSGMPSEGR